MTCHITVELPLIVSLDQQYVGGACGAFDLTVFCRIDDVDDWMITDIEANHEKVGFDALWLLELPKIKANIESIVSERVHEYLCERDPPDTRELAYG